VEERHVEASDDRRPDPSAASLRAPVPEMRVASLTASTSDLLDDSIGRAAGGLPVF
jgi:hypothetical protein